MDAAKLQFDALVALAGRAGQVIADIFTGRWTRIGADMADWTKQLGTVGAAFTVNGAPGAVGKPGAAAPDGPHGRAAATGPRPIVRTPASAAAHPNRTDLHLHLTGDAAPKAKKISATGADLTIHRGLVPA